MLLILVLASLLAMPSASPVAVSLHKPATSGRRQAASLCSQYGYYAAYGFEFNNNLWGAGAASSGSQCTTVEGTSASGVKWSSTWTWTGGQDNVKSYVNSGKQFARGLKISDIESMPTTIQWSYNQTNNVRANVAYDIFTAQDPNHGKDSGDYELMIWQAGRCIMFERSHC